MKFIDVRSDTVTQPTPEMLEAMLRAPVGDDVYGEDPTVNELQEFTAELLGKEAGLFTPSGVMGNQICLKIHTNSGDEVIVDSESHIFHYETAAPSVISQVQLHCVASANGVMDENALREAIRPDPYYFPKSTLLCQENTHNRYGGTVIPLAHLHRLGEVARENGLAYHADGARLWNACAATGISPKDYAAPFDTLSVCLSKGLGAPIGSVITGKRSHIEKARKWRKSPGGGMRQSGILAAAGLFALKNHREKLPQDHASAKKFAEICAKSEFISLNPDLVETNIVVFGYPQKMDFNQFLHRCKERGVLISSGRSGHARAVFHHQVSAEDTAKAAQIVVESVADSMK